MRRRGCRERRGSNDGETETARGRERLRLLGVELGHPLEERGELARLLARNARLRDVFAGEPLLAQRLRRVQKWQSKRLLRTYADLQRDPRYRLAVAFFFNELYGGDPRRR